MKFKTQSQIKPQSGLTWRSFLAVIYAIVVFEPALIYVALMTWNTAMFGFVAWATLIFVTQLARLSGRPLTRQEATVIYITCGVIGYMSMWVLNWLYAIYFVHSRVTAAFGLTEAIPPFYAPPHYSSAWDMRTFFHPDWVLPISISLIYLAFAILVDVSLGLLTYELYVEVEDLPFPIQRVEMEAIITVTERQQARTSVLSAVTIASAIYALILYAIPFATQAYGYIFQPIPIPWADFNYYIHMILPGSSFGIATDPSSFAVGLIIPFNVVVSIFIGSFALYFIGNAVLINYHLTKFAEEWAFAMPVSISWERSLLYAWISPIIGIGIAAGIMPLIRRREIIINALRALMGLSKERKPAVSLWFILSGFLFSTLGSVILFEMLVPDFPLWILLLLSVGWSFVFTLLSSRALGEMGMTLNVPYVKELTFIASGHPNVNIFFAPLVVVAPVGAPVWTGYFKLAKLTNTDLISVIKTYIIAGLIALLLGVMYVQSFWLQNPVPSAVYPATEIYWPINAMFQCLFIQRVFHLFQPAWLLAGFSLTAIFYLIVDFAHLPISVMGLAAGTLTPIPNAITILIGALFGKIMERIIGKEVFSIYRPVIAAGLYLGLGIMVVIGSAIAIVLRSIWLPPF